MPKKKDLQLIKKKKNSEYNDYDNTQSEEDVIYLKDSDPERNDVNKKLFDKIQSLIKTQVRIQTVANIRELSSTDLLIALAMSEGLTDEELISQFKIDYEQLDFLNSNPNFINEVQRLTLKSGFGDKNKRVQKLARVGSMLFDDLISDPEQIKFMQTKDKIKLMTEISAQIDKVQNVGAEVNPNKDITVIIKERNIDMKRLLKDKDGVYKVKSAFPTLNSITGEIEGEFANEYKRLT